MHAQLHVGHARMARPLALALLIVLAVAPTAGAQDSGTVTVTANVGAAEVTIAVCDTTATFGVGLTATGATPSNTGGDNVFALVDPAGAFYVWQPSCLPTDSFLRVAANGIAWNGTACATPNTGSSSLVTGGGAGDLRFGDPFTSYDQVVTGATRFASCSPTLSPGNWVANGSSGVHTFNYQYYLEVNPMDTSGSFQADTIWTVSTL
jgi:hypothetical protein